MIQKKTLLLLGALLVISTTNSVLATEITISSWASPKHGINATVWPTWGKWIEEATDGRVTTKVVYDLAPPNAQMDVVADGIGDASWIFHGHYAGRFTTTTLPEIPTFKDISSEALSKIYWNTHDKYLKKAKEHKGLVVVAMGVHGPGNLMTKAAVSDLSEFSSKRLRVGGGIMSDIAKSLNIAGVAMPPTGIYEAGSQGVIEGTMMTFESLKSFRLAEVFPNTLTFPGGLYRGSFSIVVNQDKWDEISPEDQTAIMSVSGEKLSALFGKMMDDQDAEGIKFAEEKGNKLVGADEKAINKAKEITAGMYEKWLKDNAKKGFDAKATQDYFNQAVDTATK